MRIEVQSLKEPHTLNICTMTRYAFLNGGRPGPDQTQVLRLAVDSTVTIPVECGYDFQSGARIIFFFTLVTR